MTLAACPGLLACQGEGERGSRALYELERMSFVPAAPCHIDGYSGPQADCTTPNAILVDLYEVTRGDWLSYFPDRSQGPMRHGWTSSVAAFDKDKLDWPAYFSLPEAQALAEARGMRLPSAAEWIHVAVGRRSQGYPWGYRPWSSVANTLELGLGAPVPVGTFENGRSRPFGCYDMLGNVWEWVSDRVPGYSSPPSQDALTVPGDELASILGGAYNTRRRRTFGSADPYSATTVRFHARTVDRNVVSPSIGARMCADAEAYLLSRSGDWGEDDNARERLVAVGARWSAVSGRDYVLPMLEILAAHPQAARGLGWLADGARSQP